MDGMKIVSIFGRGGGGSINLDIITASTLPAIVIQDRIVAITGTLAGSYYMGTNAPTNPIAGDVWIVVGEGQHGLLLTSSSPWLDIRIIAANQWNGTAWNALDAYIGKDGAWIQFSSPLPPIGTPLSSCTPEQIQEISLAGLADTYWSIGDTHIINIANTSYDIEILDFNHDTLANEPGFASITFGLKNCFNIPYGMNNSNTNSGGWQVCVMRGGTIPTILAQVAPEWQAIMRPVIKLTSAGNRSAAIVSTTDTLFLFSEMEIMGTPTYSVAGEGTRYPKFSTAAARIKSVNGVASIWWLRSPYSGSSTAFCAINTTGAANDYTASNSYGAAFGFCV